MMEKLDLEISQAIAFINELDTHISVLDRQHNAPSVDKAEEVYGKTIKIVDEILNSGVCQADVAALMQMNVLMGTLESDYSSYRTNLNLVPVLEAEKSALSMLFKALLTAAVAAIAYLVGKVIGWMLGGSSSSSSGGVVGSIGSRELKGFTVLSMADAERISKHFGNQEPTFWLKLNRLQTTHALFNLGADVVNACQKMLDDMGVRMEWIEGKDASTIRDTYGSAGIPKDYLELIDATKEGVLILYGHTDKMKAAGNSSANIARVVIESPTEGLRAREPEEFKGSIDLSDVGPKAEKKVKELGEMLKDYSSRLEEAIKMSEDHLSALGDITSDERDVYNREAVWPLKYANAIISKFITPVLGYAGQGFKTLEVLYLSLERSHLKVLKKVDTSTKEKMEAIWPKPSEDPLDFKAMLGALKNTEKTSAVKAYIEKLEVCISIKLG